MDNNKNLDEMKKMAGELFLEEYGTVALSSRRKCRRPHTVTNSSRRGTKEEQ